MRSYKSKNKIIIGSLCGVLLLMVVGYAAFSSVLSITGTSKISSNWDIKITDIQVKNVVGGAANAEAPTGIGTLNATFKTNLVSPGDSIEYDITITNGGSLNAKLDTITLSEPNNDMITFTVSGLTEGDSLGVGASKVLTIKVEYKDIPEGQEQPSSTVGSLSVALDFSQAEESITPSPTPFTGIVYSRNALSDTEGWTDEELLASKIAIGDSLEKIREYTEDYQKLNGSFFLKHIITDGLVESSEVCFISNGLHCLKPNEYEVSKVNLLEIFGESNCHVSEASLRCGSMNVYARSGGLVSANDGVIDCHVNFDGTSNCTNLK